MIIYSFPHKPRCILPQAASAGKLELPSDSVSGLLSYGQNDPAVEPELGSHYLLQIGFLSLTDASHTEVPLLDSAL